ncbi:Yip1 domain protein [Peziza echinospora]|nr:Yip1 domain protein [Peziza echinospora]
MAMMASSAAGPSSYDPSHRIESDIIDPDDLTINDLDDPLDDNPPASARLNPTATSTSSLRNTLNSHGQDRRATHDTLTEPVWTTLSRDLHSIYLKLLSVLYPRYLFMRQWPTATSILNSHSSSPDSSSAAAATKSLQEWDLWGPLLFTLLISTLLSSTPSTTTSPSTIFTGIFVLIWLGSAIITLQIKLLGANIGFFQSVSVIGYTLFPISVAALLSKLGFPAVARGPVYLVLGAWSLAAGTSVLGGSGVVRNRVALAVFPLAVFYVALVGLCVLS